MDTKVNSKPKMYVEVLENIHTNAPLFAFLHKKRKLKDHATRKINSFQRGRLAFEVVDEINNPKLEKVILKVDPEPPLQVQKKEPPHRRKKRKCEGYMRWLDKWPWKTTTTKSSIEESFLREPP